MAHSSKTIAVDVDAAIAASGMSVHQLADKTGIPRTTLRRKLKKPGTFTLDEYAELAHALNLPADALKVVR
jgi:DNA-binding phage protein